MSLLVPIAIFGWPVLVLAFFTLLPPRRAVILGMLGSWLFLPIAGYGLQGLPDITKMSITCAGVFLGAMIFDAGRFARLRMNWADAALVLWLIVPFFSSISSGYGVYDGMSGTMNQFVSWGMPYAIGRLYFGDAEGLRELAIGVFVGGLVYVPFVLFEARMSPQLHSWVYGFHQHQFIQSKRGDAWRPTVFMQHGLAVAMFMGTAALCGMWLWAAGNLRTIMAVPAWALSLGLLAVAAACRSSYALILMLAGAAVLLASRWMSTRVLLAGMLAIAPLYVAARTVGGWDAQVLRDVAGMLGQDREGSLSVRLDSENVCWRFVQSSVYFGDGRMDRLMLRNPDGGRFIPDALWLITLAKNGVVGVIAMFGFLLAPAVLFVARVPARALWSPAMAGATVLATVLVLYAMDNLMNAMVNPIYMLGAGGLAGLAGDGGTVTDRLRQLSAGSTAKAV